MVLPLVHVVFVLGTMSQGFSPNLNQAQEKRKVIRKSSTSKRRSVNFRLCDSR